MMKKKMYVWLLLCMFLLLGCARQKVEILPEQGTEATLAPTHVSEMPFHVPGHLMCEAKTEEEALEIAGLYEIELLRFHNGLAVFQTEENLDAVIERGRANGWPVLVKDGLSEIS